MHPVLPILLLVTFAAAPALAAPHAHGEGRLDVAIDGNRLSIALELPLDAVVGFERAPRNDNEKAALAAAAKVLADPALFVPTPAAQCAAEPARVTLPRFETKDEHADVDVSLVFRCAQPALLKSIDTAIFGHLKRLYRLDVQRAGPAGQGSGRLTPKQPRLAW